MDTLPHLPLGDDRMPQLPAEESGQYGGILSDAGELVADLKKLVAEAREMLQGLKSGTIEIKIAGTTLEVKVKQ